MATIGTFTKSSNGYFGSVRTLTLKFDLTVKPSTKDNDKAPDHRLYVDGMECGAGWTRTSAAGHNYISCKLDDPAFPAPIYASLVTSEDGQRHSLIWSR